MGPIRCSLIASQYGPSCGRARLRHLRCSLNSTSLCRTTIRSVSLSDVLFFQPDAVVQCLSICGHGLHTAVLQKTAGYSWKMATVTCSYRNPVRDAQRSQQRPPRPQLDSETSIKIILATIKDDTERTYQSTCALLITQRRLVPGCLLPLERHLSSPLSSVFKHLVFTIFLSLI
jgi:hypothetical protein